MDLKAGKTKSEGCIWLLHREASAGLKGILAFCSSRSIPLFDSSSVISASFKAGFASRGGSLDSEAAKLCAVNKRNLHLLGISKTWLLSHC